MNHIHRLLAICLAPAIIQARQLTVNNSTQEELLISFAIHSEKICLGAGSSKTFYTTLCDLFGAIQVSVVPGVHGCENRLGALQNATEQQRKAADINYPEYILAKAAIGLDQDYAEINSDASGKVTINLKWVGGHSPCASN